MCVFFFSGCRVKVPKTVTEMNSNPDLYVICLANSFASRGAATLAFLHREIPADQRGSIVRFNAVTPADFVLQDVASASQVAIIRGKAPRVTHNDMSDSKQVACYLSHKALWQVCADSGKPIVVVEDDARPSNMAGRIQQALSAHSELANAASQRGEPEVPLVVLLQNGSTSFLTNHDVGSAFAVKYFTGTSAYYVTPSAARLLFTRSPLAEMHVDRFMPTCIAAYDLAVYAVPGSADQSTADSTLMHSSDWDIVTERQQLVTWMLAGVVIALFIWAVTAQVCLSMGRVRRVL